MLVIRQSEDEKYSKETVVENIIISLDTVERESKTLTFRTLVLRRSEDEKYSKEIVV